MRIKFFFIIVILVVVGGLLVFNLQYKEKIIPDKISIFYNGRITMISKELDNKAVSMAFNEFISSVSNSSPTINTTYKSIKDVWQQSGFEFFFNEDHTISINNGKNITGNYFVIIFEEGDNGLLLLKNKNNEIDNEGFIINETQGLRRVYEKLSNIPNP